MIKILYWLDYLLYFFPIELLKSNIQVAIAVLNPKKSLKPGIVAVPIDLKTDWGIVLLANSITLTPGTITLDISKDKKKIYVHCLALENPKAFVDSLKETFEAKIKRLEGRK